MNHYAIIVGVMIGGITLTLLIPSGESTDEVTVNTKNMSLMEALEGVDASSNQIEIESGDSVSKEALENITGNNVIIDENKPSLLESFEEKASVGREEKAVSLESTQQELQDTEEQKTSLDAEFFDDTKKGTAQTPDVSQESFQEIIADRTPYIPPKESNPNFKRAVRNVAPQETPKTVDEDSEVLMAMNGFSNLETIEGRKVNQRIGIKSGCRVLAVVDDAFELVSGDKQTTTLSIVAPLQGCPNGFPDGVKLLAEASASKANQRINLKVTSCSDKFQRNKSLSCQGVVKDIRGVNGLEPRIYSESGWKIVARTVSSLVSTFILSDITEVAVTAGTVSTQGQGNKIRESVASAVVQAGEQIAGSFRSEPILNVSSRAVVQVLFTKDTEQW